MSYRNAVLVYTEQCFAGIRDSLTELRGKSLEITDVEEIITEIGRLKHLAELLLAEKQEKKA